jgi:tRNA pseudouridine55 synthase
MAKTYRTTLALGARSDTDDADGTVTPVVGARPPGAAVVAEAVAGFVGDVEQVPPAFSAAKVAGARAYDLARGGRDVRLEARTVRIYGIDLLRYNYPELELEARCGKGTYIRALARDLGERLGCGGYVKALRRTRVGPFTEAEALPLEADAEQARARLLPAARAVAELPALTLPPAELRRLLGGKDVAWPAPPAAGAGDDPEVAVFADGGELVLIARLDRARRRLRPEKVLRC